MINKILLMLLMLCPIVTFAEQITININARVLSKTCSILNNQVQVDMPIESIRGKSINESFGKTPFSISINDCGGNTSYANIKFDAINDLDNSKLIQNTIGEEYAKGVALGLYRNTELIDVNSSEIKYAIDKNSDRNDINFEVAYIKTSENFTLGKVKGVLNFEISYD